MIKRWRFTIAAVVIAVVATLVYQFWYRRVPAECKPVQELLSFNSAQSKVIDEKTKDDQGLPNPDQLAAYTAWADGLADRAGKVTAPNLAQPAVELATLANKFVGKLKVISSTPHAPGAPPPPEYYELTIINEQINDDIGQLKKACQR